MRKLTGLPRMILNRIAWPEGCLAYLAIGVIALICAGAIALFAWLAK